MKRLVTIVGVLVLLLALVLPGAVFADPPRDGSSEGTEVEVGDVQIDPNIALAGQVAGIGETENEAAQWASDWSDQTNKSYLDNGSCESALASGLNIAKVFGKSSATSVAKSGWVVSVGNVQLVNLENKQYSSADAEGDNWVKIEAGDANAENEGYVSADGGWASSKAEDAYSKAGDAEAKSGDYEPEAWNYTDQYAKDDADTVNVPIASGNAIDANKATSAAWAAGENEAENGEDGGVPWLGTASTESTDGASDPGDKTDVAVGVNVPVAVADEASATGTATAGDQYATSGDSSASNCNTNTQNLGGSTTATQNGDAGDSWAQNNAGPSNANGGTAQQVANGGTGGNASGSYIGNFAGEAVNIVGDICVTSQGTSNAYSGDATTGANTATTNPAINQTSSPAINQTGTSGSPYISPSNSDDDTIGNTATQSAASTLSSVLSQLQNPAEE